MKDIYKKLVDSSSVMFWKFGFLSVLATRKNVSTAVPVARPVPPDMAAILMFHPCTIDDSSGLFIFKIFHYYLSFKYFILVNLLFQEA
jgi:hypothetical protein